jgi:hypothetical protein
MDEEAEELRRRLEQRLECTAADLVKRALRELDKRLTAEATGSRLHR